MTINIALDIDGVLACKRLEMNQARFFHQKGLILTAIKTHYIFPGVIEWLRFLSEIENVRISFYSSGEKERNEILVEELLKKAFKEPQLSEFRKNIRVLSYEDTVEASEEQKEEHFTIYHVWPGSRQKDLNKVLQKGDLLENALLFEDDFTFAACQQAANCLSLRGIDEGTWRRKQDHIEIYEEEGYRYLTCVFANEVCENELMQESRTEKRITLIKKIDGFQVWYPNKEDYALQVRTFSRVDKPRLFDQLEAACQNERRGFIEDKELTREIAQLVESYGGKAKRIPRRLNQIFYATGLLMKVLDNAKTQGVSVSEALCQLQFKRKNNQSIFELNARALQRKDDLYFAGLERLKTYNAQLELTTPHTYYRAVNLEITNEDRAMLEEAVKN